MCLKNDGQGGEGRARSHACTSYIAGGSGRHFSGGDVIYRWPTGPDEEDVNEKN